jgi:hypothetical protein
MLGQFFYSSRRHSSANSSEKFKSQEHVLMFDRYLTTRQVLMLNFLDFIVRNVSSEMNPMTPVHVAIVRGYQYVKQMFYLACC